MSVCGSSCEVYTFIKHIHKSHIHLPTDLAPRASKPRLGTSNQIQYPPTNPSRVPNNSMAVDKKHSYQLLNFF